MGTSDKQVDALLLKLNGISAEIERFCCEHAFYLNFQNKAWAACRQGQQLLLLSEQYINIRIELQLVRKMSGNCVD